MLSRKMAWTIAALTSLVALAYPASVFLKLWPSSEDANRWIQNDPAFNFFMPVLFPLAVGIFLSAADFRPLRKLRQGQRIVSFAGLVVLVVIATFAVTSTFERALLEPFLFEDSSASLSEERRIRFEEIRPEYRKLRKIRDAEKAEDARVTLDQTREREIAAYQARFPMLRSPYEVLRRGSYCTWLALLINSMAALFTTAVFWYFWNLVLFREAFQLEKTEWIVLVAGLLVVWFPLRLYTEWYIGYYSFFTMDGYHVFVLLAVVAFLVYSFCVFRLAKSIGVKVFSIVGTGLIGVLGLVGQLKPEWLGAVAVLVEDLPFPWFVALMVIIVLALGAMVFSLLDLPELAVKRELRRQNRARARRDRAG